MTAQPYALLQIGSTKSPGASNSEAFGDYLCHQLKSYGWITNPEYVSTTFESKENLDALFRTIDEADLFLLVTPRLYDSLLYLVTRAMGQIVSHRRALATATILTSHFTVIINCRKPEALHNDIAVAICEQFALQAKFKWSGGLGIGGGGCGLHHSRPGHTASSKTSCASRAVQDDRQ